MPKELRGLARGLGEAVDSVLDHGVLTVPSIAD